MYTHDTADLSPLSFPCIAKRCSPKLWLFRPKPRGCEMLYIYIYIYACMYVCIYVYLHYIYNHIYTYDDAHLNCVAP